MIIELEYNFLAMHNQTKGYLLAVKKVAKTSFTAEQLDVFTRIDACSKYILDDTDYILLVMLGEKLIPYSILVPYTEEVFKSYQEHKLSVYDIKIKNVEPEHLNLRRRK